MAQNVFYQTQNNVGVDPTQYYTSVTAAGGSVTPELPAPPFATGTRAFGSDASEFIFVQASTSISLTDFVMIKVANSTGPLYGYLANSVTSTNVASSLAVGIGSTGLVLRQSATLIPAGAFFWACLRGQYIPATTSGGSPAANAPGLTTFTTPATSVALFTNATAGILSSLGTTVTTNFGIGGILCINSLTVSIPSSIVPQAGDTQSNGFTVGPVVNMNNPVAINVHSSASGSSLSSFIFSF